MGDYVLPALAIFGGAALLMKAGDMLVEHAARLAMSYHVPKTVIGALILGFGTSLPELFVSMTAALEGSPGIALGNIVGSNIANVGLILGLGALLATLHVQRRVLRVDLPLAVLGALFLMLFVGDRVTAVAGSVLLAAFASYLWLSLHFTRRYQAAQPTEPEVAKHLGRDIAWIVAGLVLIAVGAQLLVWGAERIVDLLQVTDTLIGLTVVALGTSLPELAAIIAATRRGETDLAVGNVAGSNLFNILFILGSTSLVAEVPVGDVMHSRDLPVLAVFSVLAFPLLAGARRIRRTQGLVMLASYCGYIVWTWVAAT